MITRITNIDDPRYRDWSKAIEKYYDGLDLKPGYISSRFAMGGYGDPLYALEPTYTTKRTGYVSGGRRSNARTVQTLSSPGLYIYKDPNYRAPAPAPAPVAPKPVLPTISEEAKQYRADTMKILQQADERMKAYETQRAQDEAARVEREKIAAQSAAARSANMMRAGQAPNLQIQPASQTPTTGGTQPFKRRRMQIGGVSPYLGLSISS